jgi:hypothetical protein
MDDRDEIQATVTDYFEGWYAADVERIAKSLHPDYLVRWAEDDDDAHLGVVDRDGILTSTAEGVGRDRREKATFEVDVIEVYHDIATVIVRSTEYRDYLHLLRTADGWRIVNAFLCMTEE